MTDPGSTYVHADHAGNVGDVLKHHLLGLLLARWVAATHGPRLYLESHAGQGGYRLGPLGEWTSGVGRLLAAAPGCTMRPADRLGGPWLRLLRAQNPALEAGGLDHYPGSPLLAKSLLQPADRAVLFELDRLPWERLTAALAADPRCDCRQADGFTGCLALLAEPAASTAQPFLFLDPPYQDPADWERVAEVILRAAVHPALSLACWYPRLPGARPARLWRRLQAVGPDVAQLELTTRPPRARGSGLRGSGLVLLRPPAGILPELAAALPVIGAVCSAFGSWFDARSRHG